MNRMEVPQDYNTNDSFYQNKLLQSIGINYSHGQTTNDTSANLHNLIRNNISLGNDTGLDEEVFDLKEATKNIEDQEATLENALGTSQLKTSNTKNKTNYERFLQTNHAKHRRAQEVKHCAVNKENVGLPEDLQSVLVDSDEKEDINDRYTSPSIKAINTLDRGKELLTITVEIGNGQKENIIIYENDDAEQISEEFWNKHQIQDELRLIFTNQIAENIIQVREEIANEQTESNDEEVIKEESYQHSSSPSIEQPLYESDIP